MFHVNILKDYQVRAAVEDNCYAEELKEDIPVWKSEKKVTFGEELTSTQMKELHALLHDISSVFSDKPRRTDLAEYHIVTDQPLLPSRPPTPPHTDYLMQCHCELI